MADIKKRPAVETPCFHRPFLVSHRTDDIDELGHVARNWDLDFRQLSPGPFQCDLVQWGLDRIQLGRARLRGHIRQRGSTPTGYRTFAIPATRDIRLSWRGHAIGQDHLMVFPRCRELESVSHPDFDILTISVVEDELDAAAERMELPSFDRLLIGREIVPCDPALLFRTKLSLRRALRDAPNATAAVTAERTAEILLQLVTSVSRVSAPGTPARSRSTELSDEPARGPAMQRALDVIERAKREPLAVADIARAAGCSERSLRRAFHRRFGVGPKTYLHAQRLTGVRRQLRGSDPENTLIADVANEWGFWHMGQFAADFRRFFGVLPSKILGR